MNAIIVYSGGSNTTAVAQYIAEKTGGKAVTVPGTAEIDFSAYDKVIIGTRVRAGKVPSDISEFVAKNKASFEGKAAFFLCCMYNDDKGQRQLDKIASQLGFQKAVFFTKGKKIVKEAGNPVDDFITSL